MPKRPEPQIPPTSQPSSTSSKAPLIDLQCQQQILDIYAAAFSDVISSESFLETLQEIKQALFNREFAAAFGKAEYLEAYAARWSPTRALGYATIFKSLQGYICDMRNAGRDELQESPDHAVGEASSSSSKLRMLCVGGCAAEHVAFASLLRLSSCQGNLTLLDSASWSSICHKLQHHITTPPVLSRYASAAVKASNHAFIPSSHLELNVQQHDVLSLSTDELRRLTGDKPILITTLFTLNELYTEGGIGKTTRFLGALGDVLASESLLLVVDSPGSYSEAAVGKEKKRYPMHWLLDHSLLQKCPPGVSWEKLESQDSAWFRLPEGLAYPISLENMRYQLHLYRLKRGPVRNG